MKPGLTHTLHQGYKEAQRHGGGPVAFPFLGNPWKGSLVSNLYGIQGEDLNHSWAVSLVPAYLHEMHTAYILITGR